MPNPSTVSTIIITCIALAAVLVSPFILLVGNIIADKAKWRRESKTARVKQIDEATVNLLAPKSGDERKRFYAWARAIWKHCNPAERRQIKSLQQDVEVHSGNPTSVRPDIIEKAFSITNAVRERFD